MHMLLMTKSLKKKPRKKNHFHFSFSKRMSIAQLVEDLQKVKDLAWIAECEYKDLKRKEEEQKAKLDALLHSFSQTDIDEIHQWIDYVLEKARMCWDGTPRFVFQSILPWMWNKSDTRGLHARNECLSSSYKEILIPSEKMKQLFDRLHIDWVVEEYDSTRHKC